MTYSNPIAVIVILISVTALTAQSPPTKTPFEVASIKPCSPDTTTRTSRSGAGTPGLLRTTCQTVRDLIVTAYAAYADGHTNPPPLPPVEGGPRWIDSERYTIEAKAEGSPTGGVMHGPMLQALLEDRFQLKIRRELRGGPAHALTVANGGPKLQPHVDGSCVNVGAVAPRTEPVPPHIPGERLAGCGFNVPAGNKGGNISLDVRGVTLDYFSKTFLGISLPDRPVMNKTGLPGLFDIRLEFAPEETAPGSTDIPTAPSIFTAVQQQLGLKLIPARGPREFIVIEQVEHPSSN